MHHIARSDDTIGAANRQHSNSKGGNTGGKAGPVPEKNEPVMENEAP